VPRRMSGERIGRLTGRSSESGTHGLRFDTRFRPSQPHLQRQKATTRRKAVFTTATVNAPCVGATRQPAHGMPTGATPSADAATRITRRATAAASEAHPRAEGFARAGAVRRRATRGGALDACPNAGRTTLRRKRRPAGTCTSTSSSSSAPRETTGETPRGGEADGEKAGWRVSWTGVQREFLSYTPSKVCRFVIAVFFFSTNGTRAPKEQEIGRFVLVLTRGRILDSWSPGKQPSHSVPKFYGVYLARNII